MALTDLIAKILNEAKKEVVKIETDLAEKIELMEADYEAKISESQKKIKEDLTSKKAMMLKKVKTLGVTQQRNLLLKTKQDVAEDVLSALIEKIVNLPDAEYENLMAAIFEASGKVEGAIFHPAKGKENQIINGMKKAKMAYKQGASLEIKGGFILVSDKVEIDNSLESLIKQELAPKLEPEISKVLFG